jgi:hypothetical protein
MNSIPASAGAMIVVFVGIPAGLMRALAVISALASGTAWLSGVPTVFNVPAVFAFLGCLLLSVVAYLMVVVIDYVLAKHRDAVPMNDLIRGLIAEITVQTGGIVGTGMVLAAMLADTSKPLLMIFGPLICIATLTYAFTHNRRIKEWRAAWNGDYSVVPPPVNDGGPII